jgi:hypothetical protein
VTLTHLRVDDKLEPASHPIWTSAISLAAAPRPFVRLVGLNAGRWPRRISEDRLIPDHIIATKDLDPLPIADGDRRDFASIIASAEHATFEPPQPLTKPTPNPASDPPPEMPGDPPQMVGGSPAGDEDVTPSWRVPPARCHGTEGHR